MISPHILPDGNVQIAFSGGRTSAYMLHEILAAICPVCHGWGRTSIDPNTGKPVPQPFKSNSTTFDSWDVCAQCQGSGAVIVAIAVSG